MDATFSIATLPLPKAKWTIDTHKALEALCADLAALLAQTGAVRLEGDHTPISRLSYNGERITAHGVDGGAIDVHVIGTMEQAVDCAIVPILANHIFLSAGTTHSCILGDGKAIVLVDGRPYADLTLETKGASLGTLGLMPPWRFVFQGKPSRIEVHDAGTLVDKVLKRLKKEEPHFVLRDDATGQWYKRWTLNKTNATVLEWTGSPQRAYAWTRREDVLLHAMALEGLYASNWRTKPTAPGWDGASKPTSDINISIHNPVQPLAFSVHRYDPRHGGTEEVVPATRFRAQANIRRHQETIGVAPYGALACEVLAHVDADAPGVDRFVAVCDPTHGAPIAHTLAALGVATRKNPHVRLAQKKGYHAHLPTVWSMALSEAVETALVQQASSWPEVVVADHPWKDMWP